MPTKDVCNRNVVTIAGTAAVAEAARLMREKHVGTVVVVEPRDGRKIPTGIVTDRDITIAVTALGLDPAIIQVSDLAAQRFVSVDEDRSVAEVIELMQVKGVRRMVVTSRDGALHGIVTADDVMTLLADELTTLARIASGGREREARLRQTAS